MEEVLNEQRKMACIKAVNAEKGQETGKMQQQKSIIEIYTDWANHYLEKTRAKRKISDLQAEVCDGLVLSEVIEVVTQQKVPDINKKPKTNAQMVGNIQACLNFLIAKRVAVEEINAEDINEGNLKAILGLFFQLSRYKQQQKQLTGNSGSSGKTNIAAPASPAKNTNIPMPASHLQSPKRCVDPNKRGDQTSGIRSFLPGKSCNVTSSGGNKQNIQSGVTKPPAVRHTKVMQSQGVQSSMPQQESATKQSMLDRFKLGKTSPITNSPIKRGLGKRTSSSSGFSSARSDRSESSISLSSDTNFPSPSALRRIQETQHGAQSSGELQQGPGNRAGVKNKLGRSPVLAHADKQSSPKRSPKLGRSSGVTAIKDYGMIDERQGGEKQARPLNYPPHAYSTCRNGVQLKHTNIISGVSSVSNNRTEPPESRIQNPCDAKAKATLSSGIPSPRGRPPPAPPVRTVTDPSKSAECKSGEAPMVRNVQPNGSLCGKPQLSESGEGGTSEDKIGEQSAAPASLNPLQNNEMEETHKKIPQPHCSQTETEAPANSSETKTAPEPSLSSSFHSRTCSLPRQKRLGDSSPSPNVAIVSPMPSLTRSQTMSVERESSSNAGNSVVPRDKLPVGPIKRPESPQKKEEVEDPLQGISPMAPLGLFSGRSSHGQVPRMHFSRIRKSQEFPPNMQTVNPALLSGPESDQLYKLGLSDGYPDVGLASGYLSDGDAITRTNTHGPIDGYVSEGGAEFYTNKIQARLAYEKQRSENEAKHQNYVSAREPGSSRQHQPLPEVLRPLNKSTTPSMAPPAIYRVIGGRKNVQKADSGIQTEASAQHQLTQQQEQWRAAMEHNKQVLTNQEQAMEEYLRRQCKEAEKHIQRQSPMMGRRHGSNKHDFVQGTRNNPQTASHISQHPSRNGIASMPGTPTGSRRSSVQGSASANYRYLQQNGPNGPSGSRGMVQMADTGIDGQRRQDPSVPWADMARQNPKGGSLERQQHKYNPAMVHVTYSDNEHYRVGKQNFKSHSPVIQSENEKMQRNSRQNTNNSSKSLPKGTSALNYGLLMGQIQQKRQQRQNKNNDGSISDSNYATYQEIQGLRGGSASPYQWLQPANTYGGRTKNTDDSMGSNESLNSISSSIQQARANSLTKANLMEHQKQTRQIVSHNSISRGSPSTSTKSDLKYGMKQEETEYYGVPFILRNDPKGKVSQFKSQPTSPTSDVSSRPEMSIASMSSGPNSLNYSSLPSYGSSAKQRHKKSSLEPRENLNGSNLSLVSTGSSVYSNQEDKTNSDIQKLRWELAEEHEKVLNLTSQLSTNAHVVSAFEQSLGNMTARLQEITKTAERKDAELLELKQTIDRLRQSGVDAGLVSSKHQPQPNQLLRQMSTDSVASMSSNHSNSSLNSGDEKERGKKQSTGPKRSGWLRTSFSKAFSKSKMKHKGGSVSDVEDGSVTKMMDNLEVGSDHSDDQSLFPPALDANCVKTSQSSSDLHKNEEDTIDPQVVNELKRQLIEKDCLLTETRLEALSSAHQLESLRETVTKMKTELMSLKQDNDKLQSHVVSKSLGSSVTSLNTTTESEMEKRLSMTISESSHMSVPSTLDMSGTTDPSNQENKPVSVTVILSEASIETQVKIGNIAASCKLSWQLLDSLIERLFKEYIMLVDPVASLGLTSESIQCYLVGEVRRKIQQQPPELLPYGYLIGDVDSIKIVLRNAGDCGGVDALAFETLTPNSIIQRYVSLLQEHKRVILCGPSGTGKTYMAAKLADFLVRKFRATGRMSHVQTFALCRNNQEAFNNFLDKVSADCSAGHPDTPSVIILDNLHHVPHLDQVLEEHLTTGLDASPYIIGTMNQTTNTTTNLQLRHNFRWILCASHIEPVRGYLGRQLRQRLLLIEVETRTHNGELTKVLDFIVKAQIIINKFLESHCSPDSTLSSRLFLTCPMEVTASRSWFINLWNLTVVPHILDQVREGLELYGRRASWEDPLSLMMELWPWNVEPEMNLQQVLPEHVGYDTRSPLQEDPRPMSGSHSMDSQNDPLFNMLVTLQEAANIQTGDL